MPYRRHPTAKRTDSKLKKAKRNPDHPPHHFNRTEPATTKPEKRKIRTVPPSAPRKCPNKVVLARHSTQRRHTHRKHMTRPAREIPTDPAHQNKETGDKYNKRIDSHRLQNKEKEETEPSPLQRQYSR